MTFRLVHRAVPESLPPELDESQQAVVDLVGRPGHGPVLVLAGPGTGKTTTLVEAVVSRVAGGATADRVLTLTFSRRAASELRERICGRLAVAAPGQAAWTFHAFAYGLVGLAAAPQDAGREIRLMSGPEQDVVVRELLAGDVSEHRERWPVDLWPALSTRGFADEVRALLARARTFGLDPGDLWSAALRRSGASASAEPLRPSDKGAPWAAAAEFFSEYLDVLDSLGALDYSELVHRAVAYAQSPEGEAYLRARYDLVVVDEYQDTDPAQERLLAALAGDGRDLVVVGDPDQSIYAFRGAAVRGLLEFRDRFRTVDGDRATVRTLRTSRRAGGRLLASSRAVASRLPVAGSGLAEHLREHRRLSSASGQQPGQVRALTFPTAGLQLEAVADLLRREHLDAGTAWSDMAVLVRSASRTIPELRRVLGASGIPVEVAGDEMPLGREPSVAPLLLALRAAADPSALTAQAARALLLSPLGHSDAAALRRLARALRDHEREALQAQSSGGIVGFPRPSDELLAEGLADPSNLVAIDARTAAPALRLARLLRATRQLAEGGASAHEVLWALWDGTSWPRRLERTAAQGGPAGRAAGRDLDAVVALFDAAIRDSERGGKRGIVPFLHELEAQQIPADTLAERGLRAAGVRVLTAHRSKGLEWPVVVVVDVQEDVWPDLRFRGSLLEPDRLDPGTVGALVAGDVDDLVAPRSARALLAEERRLFYVAVTRAKRLLVVTAVDSAEDDGVRPSRFLSELGVPVEHVRDRPRRPLTLAALVAELRSTAADADQSEALRLAAASRLAVLAGSREGAAELVPAAHPTRWWGVADMTDPGAPMYPADQAIRLSGSALTAMAECPLRWFLEHEVRAQQARSVALGFGSIVHALARDVAAGASPPDLAHLLGLVDSVWGRLGFEARWRSEREREAAGAALARFLEWNAQDRGRELRAVEHRFAVDLTVGGRPVVLTGSMDRVEIDADGFVHVVDLKTGKVPPAKAAVESNIQLAVYQHSVRVGSVADVAPAATSAGAELVQLRTPGAGVGPLVLSQGPLAAETDDGSEVTWIDDVIATAATRMADERFPATVGGRCRTCSFRKACPAQPDGRQLVS